MSNTRKPLIFVTNDDGYKAKGLEALVEMVRPFGQVIVVAPEEANSGMSHAITVKVPVRLKRRKVSDDVEVYSVTGTPVDCVKLAMNQLFKSRTPDLLVSGINHGSNASVSIVYSGTMAAALEGSLYKIPSIGFSVLDYSDTPDFEATVKYGRTIVQNVLKFGLAENICLNVNVPVLPADEIKGIKVVRQNKGVWREEFEKRIDPRGVDYFWLTGYFQNEEPEATDTDEYYLSKGYITIVPIHADFTCYKEMKRIEGWNLDFVDGKKHEAKSKIEDEE